MLNILIQCIFKINYYLTIASTQAIRRWLAAGHVRETTLPRVTMEIVAAFFTIFERVFVIVIRQRRQGVARLPIAFYQTTLTNCS